MSEVRVVPITPEDKQAVVKMFNQEKKIWPWGGGVIFWRFFNNRGRTEQWVKAVIDDQVVGFAHWAMKADNTRTLYDIIVSPEHRGKGVGRKLIDVIGTPIDLKTDADADSNGFYNKLGFTRGETVPTKDGSKFTTSYHLPRRFDTVKISNMAARITTYSGRQIDLLNLKPEDIVIEDIAHALACCNRFSGHTAKPLSVAQHSVCVSKLSEQNPMQGLLHDGSEAYIGDITYYLKKTDVFEEYRTLEARIQELIYEKFGCPREMQPDVADADKLMVRWEAPRGFGHAWTWEGVEGYSDLTPEETERVSTAIGKWAPWPWRQAEEQFLVRYRALMRR